MSIIFKLQANIEHNRLESKELPEKTGEKIAEWAHYYSTTSGTMLDAVKVSDSE